MLLMVDVLVVLNFVVDIVFIGWLDFCLLIGWMFDRFFWCLYF